MKVLAGLLCVGTSIQAYAASSDALLYTSDSKTLPNSKSPSISSSTARLLLAQRLGLSQYHELNDVDEHILEILNTHGGSQQPLFPQDGEDVAVDKILIVVEVVEEPEGII